MKRYNEDQLNEKIASFLSKKYQKYPEIVPPRTVDLWTEVPHISVRLSQYFTRAKSRIINY
ncbi:MAG: hypothetical protein ABI716_00390 [Candidatus Saccharibacteria bacterium]